MTERLIVRAPVLPPTRRIVFLFGSNPKLFRASSIERFVLEHFDVLDFLS